VSAAETLSVDRLTPVPMRVVERIRESADSVTLVLDRPQSCPITPGAPGQFNMLYPFGTGEAAISLSGDAGDSSVLVHTIRGVGPVSEAFRRAQPGEWIGVRGPFGVGWPMDRARGRTLLLVAGGIGLAPLRPVIYAALRDRAEYDRLMVFYGTRSPRHRLYVSQLTRWEASRTIELDITVDAGGANWGGKVGFVTALLQQARFEPGNTLVMTCGPEIMMRAVANLALQRGVAPGDIYVSLERNMKCAIGLCGHCQIGPVFACKDGPVFSYDRVEELLRVREI
jgi:NAD(P)H-flavin reductase